MALGNSNFLKKVTKEEIMSEYAYKKTLTTYQKLLKTLLKIQKPVMKCNPKTKMIIKIYTFKL